MSAPEPITCRAAVCWAAATDLVIEEVTVAPPQAGEVRVRLLATGVCHTDAFAQSGDDPEGIFPVILGHEGCGIVESIGEGVTTVAVGDKVVPLYIPQCLGEDQCCMCASGKSNLCCAIRTTQGRGVMPDGTSRFTCRRGGEGEPQEIFHFMGTSTFSEYTVLPEISVAVVNSEAPPAHAGLLGCGVTTGYGSVVNTLQVEAGATAAVFGLGAVGLAAVMGLRMAGASRIIAVDLNPGKFELARELGATDCLNPADHDEPTQNVIKGMTEDASGGGVDYSIEAIGNVNTMRAALECVHKGWGKSCIIGVAGAGQEISTRPFQLVTGRWWGGTAFGGCKGRTELPGIVDQAMAGEIPVDKFVTHTMPLDDVNRAFHLMHAGESIRSVLEYSSA